MKFGLVLHILRTTVWSCFEDSILTVICWDTQIINVDRTDIFTFYSLYHINSFLVRNTSYFEENVCATKIHTYKTSTFILKVKNTSFQLCHCDDTNNSKHLCAYRHSCYSKFASIIPVSNVITFLSHLILPVCLLITKSVKCG